jgi:hypothetical protein
MARIRSQWLIRLGLLLLFWLDVLTHAPRQNPTVERWVYDPVAELRHWSPAPRHGESRAMPSLAAELEMHNSALPNAAEDYMRKRMGLYCNCNLLENIPKVNGVFSLHLREAEQVNTLMYGSTDRHFPRLADFLNVSQITTPGKTIDWVARTNYLPLISSGQQPVFVTDDECLRGLESSEFNSRETVFLPIEMRNAMTVTTPSELRIVSHQSARKECSCRSKGANLVYWSSRRLFIIRGKPTWTARPFGSGVRTTRSKRLKFPRANTKLRWLTKTGNSAEARSFPVLRYSYASSRGSGNGNS